jgi:hypothetical protein
VKKKAHAEPEFPVIVKCKCGRWTRQTKEYGDVCRLCLHRDLPELNYFPKGNSDGRSN